VRGRRAANRDQVAFCNRTNVALTERHESLRLSGRENELNVETICSESTWSLCDADRSCRAKTMGPV
jgi:hypothetical protein